MKFLIPAAVSLFLVFYLIYNINGAHDEGYIEGYKAGYEAERPVELILRNYGCIPEGDIPHGYPFISINDTTIILVHDKSGEEMPLKVCPQEVIQKHIDTLVEEITQPKK